jgi:hypothetical protein
MTASKRSLFMVSSFAQLPADILSEAGGDYNSSSM